MRAIILAAGYGSRIAAAHQGPKSLLEFGGKSLLQRHLENLASRGIEHIAVCVGYEAGLLREAIEASGHATRVSTVLNPAYRGEIQVANPNSSGTAYIVIATLVQMMGEDQAFEFLRSLHGSVNAYPRSGTAPITARVATVLRGRAPRLIAADREPDRRRLAALRERHPEVEAIEGPMDIEHPSAPAGSVVVLSACLHHVHRSQRRAALEALRRAAAVVVVAEPLRRTWLSVLFVFLSCS